MEKVCWNLERNLQHQLQQRELSRCACSHHSHLWVRNFDNVAAGKNGRCVVSILNEHREQSTNELTLQLYDTDGRLDKQYNYKWELMHVSWTWKYLFIIDNAVFLVVRFYSGELHHEVHKVRAAFLALQDHTEKRKRSNRTFTLIRSGKISKVQLPSLHLTHSPRWSSQSLWKSDGPASPPSPCGPVDGPSSARWRREKEEDRKKKKGQGVEDTNDLDSFAAELVTEWWLLCKQLNQSCTNSAPAANPASLLTQSAASPLFSQCVCRECKHATQLVRISTYALK